VKWLSEGWYICHNKQMQLWHVTFATEGAYIASHRSLWKVLPMLEHILDHFKALKKQVKNSDFNDYLGIQNSIIKAWNKTKDYYIKTDASII